MAWSIGICFGKMGSLHDGLGEYGMQFGEHLARRAVELRQSHGIALCYRLPVSLHGAFGRDVDYLPQHALHRMLAMHPTRFDLWHTLHQHVPYRPALGARLRLATVHDLNHLYSSDESFRAKAVRRLAGIVARSDALVAISEHTRRDLEKHLAPKVPITVIYNGVRDLTTVVPTRPEALPAGLESADGPGFFLHLSRMAPSKNVEALLGMMQLMPARRLVLAGPRTSDSERIRVAIEAMGLANVQLLHEVSMAEKAWLFRHCSAFMFPSLTEGFGLPPIEAMQFGKPVFLSDRTSLPEVGGEVASYWPSFDPEAMRQVVVDRLQRETHEPLVERTRAWAARFTWASCIEAHVDTYLNMLDGLPLD